MKPNKLLENEEKLSDLLIGKNIDDIRMQFDLWIAIFKAGGEKAGDIFNAYELLAKSARAKGIKLELKKMADLIGFKETITYEEGTMTLEMSREMVLYYIQMLDKLIKTDRVDKYNIAVYTEQLAYQCMLKSVLGDVVLEVCQSPWE